MLADGKSTGLRYSELRFSGSPHHHHRRRRHRHRRRRHRHHGRRRRRRGDGFVEELMVILWRISLLWSRFAPEIVIITGIMQLQRPLN